MTIDCCPFFNELDILELRLRTLESLVDHHYIVQSPETHSGLPKPVYFDPSHERWTRWSSKISTVLLPRIETGDRWVREHATREVIPGLLTSQSPSDVVIISDVDEIPDPDAVRQVIPELTPERWAGFLTECYLYYLNLRIPKPFHCIGVARVDTVRTLGAQTIRDRKRKPPIGPIRAGWHFTYQGGVAAIQTKLSAFAHAEYDTPQMKDPVWLADRIRRRRDLYHPGLRRFVQVPLTELPRDLQERPAHYAHLLLPEPPS